jgi:hypothetical protein
MGHVAQYGPLDGIEWLRFKKKKIAGNFFPIAGDPDPARSGPQLSRIE